MPHIFISYAKKDTRKLATDLADALNALPGYTAWVDRSLRAGAAWEAEIQREILKCDVFVVLYSPDINRHLNGEEECYVLTEISYAKFTAKKPIIPVMAQTTAPPISLTRMHYIDFTIGGLTVADLVEALCDEIGQPVPAAPPPVAPPVTRKRPSSIDLLPAPFAWVDIPAGRVTLEKGGYLDKPTTFEVPRFTIGKYPVTNEQYALFVEAGGYGERKSWTDAGWETRTGESLVEPRAWRNSALNGVVKPVVGVSWYESVAYSRWLSDMTGERITLPTEQQWQRAAQGDDGRRFPWGSDWNCKRCNNFVSPCASSATTQVWDYEGEGDSPFGVVDMAGNVCEWCLTAYENGSVDVHRTDDRVLRGGSWRGITSDGFGCRYRYKLPPLFGDSDGGFALPLTRRHMLAIHGSARAHLQWGFADG
jgi:formylglycine-generating enzyme required for sulfatase activity